jgi:hypothetical protein
MIVVVIVCGGVAMVWRWCGDGVRWCGDGVRWCGDGVAVVWRWCAVVWRWCGGGVARVCGGVAVVWRWCGGGVAMVCGGVAMVCGGGGNYMKSAQLETTEHLNCNPRTLKYTKGSTQ